MLFPPAIAKGVLPMGRANERGLGVETEMVNGNEMEAKTAERRVARRVFRRTRRTRKIRRTKNLPRMLEKLGLWMTMRPVEAFPLKFTATTLLNFPDNLTGESPVFPVRYRDRHRLAQPLLPQNLIRWTHTSQISSQECFLTPQPHHTVLPKA
jgi:hypothetical protein